MGHATYGAGGRTVTDAHDVTIGEDAVCMNDSILGMFPLLLLMALMVWMLVSQRRRQREVSSMQSSLAVGDEVVTVGGVIGRLVGAEGPVLQLEVSRGVVIRIDRRTVSGRTADVPALQTRAPAADSTPGVEQTEFPDLNDRS